jgi:predicted Zn-dependent protease
MTTMNNPRIHHFIRLLPVALVILAAAPRSTSAEAEPPKKEISDEVSSELAKLKEKVDAKDYAGAVKLLDGILAKAEPDTYDIALASQLKVQILLTEGNYEAAIPALQTANSLGEKHGFYEKKVLLDQLYLLGQIHYQIAAETKDPARQQEYFRKAYQHIRRWLDTNPKPTPEGQLFASSILYGHATLDPNKPDQALLRQARDEARAGMYLGIRTPDQLYVLLLASLQQLGDHRAAIDVLEEMTRRQPQNALYWQQLTGSYLALSNEATEEREIRRFQLLTILTIQRAQTHGHMNTPKDHANIIGMFFNLEQFEKAGELLTDGIKTQKIENSRANWELLCLAYQQGGHEERAIDCLRQAADLFPSEGQLDLTIAQMHYGAGRLPETLGHLERAVTKGNLKKPGAAYLFLGFTAYELQKFEDAAKWAEAAGQHADTKPEDAKRLKRAAQEALKERQALKDSKV